MLSREINGHFRQNEHGDPHFLNINLNDIQLTTIYHLKKSLKFYFETFLFECCKKHISSATYLCRTAQSKIFNFFPNLNVQFQKISIPTPWKVNGNSEGVVGLEGQNFVRKVWGFWNNNSLFE